MTPSLLLAKHIKASLSPLSTCRFFFIKSLVFSLTGSPKFGNQALSSDKAKPSVGLGEKAKDLAGKTHEVLRNSQGAEMNA